MRLRGLLAFLLLFAAAPPLRAEYVLLRNGQRLAVSAYERLGSSYRLQISGGAVEVAAADVVAIEPEEVFRPAPAADDEKAPYHDLIQAAALRNGVDPDLVTSVIAAESGFDARAVSRRNARGLMQLLPETAQRLGVKDIFDPRENIEGGTRYLRELLERYHQDVVLALAAYNAGPERVRQFGRVPPYAETQSYVQRVKRNYQQQKAQRRPQRAGGGVPAEQGLTRGAAL
ncbi:MAG: lytic transglycosylase domain-containing protein [Acidobacteriia bacterium]|nr:lytic transglycosylase domain-containing protein [Terriglobia bacterium]